MIFPNGHWAHYVMFVGALISIVLCVGLIKAGAGDFFTWFWIPVQIAVAISSAGFFLSREKGR